MHDLDTLTTLFGDENPIGKNIKINRINFEVIGILPIKGSTPFVFRTPAICVKT